MKILPLESIDLKTELRQLAAQAKGASMLGQMKPPALQWLITPLGAKTLSLLYDVKGKELPAPDLSKDALNDPAELGAAVKQILKKHRGLLVEQIEVIVFHQATIQHAEFKKGGREEGVGVAEILRDNPSLLITDNFLLTNSRFSFVHWLNCSPERALCLPCAEVAQIQRTLQDMSTTGRYRLTHTHQLCSSLHQAVRELSSRQRRCLVWIYGHRGFRSIISYMTEAGELQEITILEHGNSDFPGNLIPKLNTISDIMGQANLPLVVIKGSDLSLSDALAATTSVTTSLKYVVDAELSQQISNSLDPLQYLPGAQILEPGESQAHATPVVLRNFQLIKLGGVGVYVLALLALALCVLWYVDKSGTPTWKLSPASVKKAQGESDVIVQKALVATLTKEHLSTLRASHPPLLLLESVFENKIPSIVLTRVNLAVGTGGEQTFTFNGSVSEKDYLVLTALEPKDLNSAWEATGEKGTWTISQGAPAPSARAGFTDFNTTLTLRRKT